MNNISYFWPKTPKQIKQFLGLVGYYNRHIENFSKIAAPMNHLLKKNIPFDWTTDCETAFQTLKTKLTTAPVLAFPIFTLPFDLYTDASGVAAGVILAQTQNGVERVIAYAGRTFNQAEQNYTVTEQEALAVLIGVRKFAPYLQGRKFTVYTDHRTRVKTTMRPCANG